MYSRPPSAVSRFADWFRSTFWALMRCTTSFSRSSTSTSPCSSTLFSSTSSMVKYSVERADMISSTRLPAFSSAGAGFSP